MRIALGNCADRNVARSGIFIKFRLHRPGAPHPALPPGGEIFSKVAAGKTRGGSDPRTKEDGGGRRMFWDPFPVHLYEPLGREPLGSGTYGSVYLLRRKESCQDEGVPEFVAMKEIPNTENPQMKKQRTREISLPVLPNYFFKKAPNFLPNAPQSRMD